MNDSAASNENDSSDEENERLLKANSQLQEQLASLTTLYASLAPQQSGDALVSFGTGTNKRWLNARSIRMLSLSEGMSFDLDGGRAAPSGTFALHVDELQVTNYLPADEAERALDQVAEAINRVLQPA